MGNNFSLFKEYYSKVKALRPLVEHLQNRVRALIEAENDMSSRYELRNALLQLRKRLGHILYDIPPEKCPQQERTAIVKLCGELLAMSDYLKRSHGQLFSAEQASSFRESLKDLNKFLLDALNTSNFEKDLFQRMTAKRPDAAAALVCFGVAAIAAGFLVLPLLPALGVGAGVAAITFTAVEFVAPLGITFLGAAGGAGALIAGAVKKCMHPPSAPNFVHLGTNPKVAESDAARAEPSNNLNANVSSFQQAESDVPPAASASAAHSAFSDPYTSFLSTNSQCRPSSPKSPESLSDCDSGDSENERTEGDIELTERSTGARFSATPRFTHSGNRSRTGRTPVSPRASMFVPS